MTDPMTTEEKIVWLSKVGVHKYVWAGAKYGGYNLTEKQNNRRCVINHFPPGSLPFVNVSRFEVGEPLRGAFLLVQFEGGTLERLRNTSE